MKRPMQNNDTTDSIAPVTHAAYAHVETVVAQADGYSGSSPWWHGWAVREAFEAGAEWQRSAGNSDLQLENESLQAKLESRRVLLDKLRRHLIEKDVLADFGPELFQIINNSQ